MKTLYLLIPLLLTFISAKKKKKLYERDDTVIVLNEKNFNRTIHQIENLLVVFHASWCGHCKNFLPTFTKASLMWYNQKPRINWAKIEMSNAKSIGSLYNITGYPTVLFFKHAQPYKYTGTMNEQGIMQWMIKKSRPILTEWQVLADITNFKNTNEVAIIYFGNNQTYIDILFSIAADDSDNVYAKCDFETAYSTFNARKDTIVWYRNFGGFRTELSGKWSTSGIINFISRNSLNKILPFNDRTAKLIWKDKNPALFWFRDPSSFRSDSYDQLFKNIADKLVDRIKVVIAGIFEPNEQNWNSVTNVQPSDWPCVRIYDPRKKIDGYYLMSGDINEINVMRFVNDYEENKLKMELKSENIITKQKGNIFEIVSKTYHKDVIENDFNVLVLYYSHWTDNYQEWIQMYDKIAVDYGKVPKYNLRVSMIDWSRNELDLKDKIHNYPCIRWYWNNKKEDGIQFKGEKTYSEWKKFIDLNLGYTVQEVDLKLDNDTNPEGDSDL